MASSETQKTLLLLNVSAKAFISMAFPSQLCITHINFMEQIIQASEETNRFAFLKEDFMPMNALI